MLQVKVSILFFFNTQRNLSLACLDISHMTQGLAQIHLIQEPTPEVALTAEGASVQPIGLFTAGEVWDEVPQLKMIEDRFGEGWLSECRQFGWHTHYLFWPLPCAL